MSLSRILFVLLSFLYIAAPCAASSYLDEYLNNIKLDQRTPQKPSDKSQWKYKELASETALGQSFRTGANVEEIYQIAIESPLDNSRWGEGTTLVMTLYDGPSKTTQLGRSEMKYEWRWWEQGRIVFPIKVKAQEDRSYYFELTCEGGNGKIGPIMIAESDYPRGQAYVDGKPQEFDFIFEDYVRTSWDRDKSYQDQFAKINLDYPGLEKVKAAVQSKDWDTAAKELVAHFESRTDLMEINLPPNNNRPEPPSENVVMAAEMSVKEADGKIISLGPNWNHLRWWPNRGGVGLTREGIRKHLATGYVKTGDEKYAIAWTNLLKAVFTDLPSPIKSGTVSPDAKDIPPVFNGGIDGGSMWAGLSIAARMRHGFWYYKYFAKSPNFPWDVKAAFIMNMVDMADMLAIEKGGGNWADQMNMGLFEFGRDFPEYTRAREFGQLGFDGLITNMRETLLPDGPIGESAGYQMLVHGTYLTMIADAKKSGLRVPRDVYKKLENALQFLMYTMQPDGGRPPFGDALGDTAKELLKRGYNEFYRRDMLWTATGGQEGEQPAKTSIEFPYSKFCVMRSDWTPDQLYMCLKNGRYTSHGHFDSLGFVMYGYGNPLIVDPGIYIYGTPDTVRLISTKSHSTISVDGANLHNGGSPNQFFTGDSIDYFCGIGPEYQGLPASIYPVRRVVFLKDDYWVFSDVIRGEGERQIDSRFHFINKNALLDQNTGIARTTHAKGGNLAIIPVDKNKLSFEMEDADTAFVHEKLAPALMLKQSAKTSLPFRMDNVLYPYKGKRADAKVTSLTPDNPKDQETAGVRVDTGKGTDYIVFTGGSDVSAEFAAVNLKSSAQCAAVRTSKSGKIRSFSWIWGSRIEYGKVLAQSKRPVPGLDVVYDGDVIRITTKGEEPTLGVAASGAKRAIVNGSDPKPVQTTDGFFYPFESDNSLVYLVDNETSGFAIEKPIKGSSVAGDGETGFCYYWSHVSPGRESVLSYTPSIDRDGTFEIKAFVPAYRQHELTEEAHYLVKFKSGGKWTAPEGEWIKSVNSANTASGTIELRINQKAKAGEWVSLGKYEITRDSRPRVEVRADAEVGGPVVVADAVKWIVE